MQLYNVLKKEQGFTLIEVLITVIIIGVLSAIATPNLIGLYNQNQIKQGMGTVEGSLKEAQRQAKKLGKTCTVSFNNATKQITATPNGCLLSDRTLNNQVTIADSSGNSSFNLAFSYKGTYGSLGTTIIISGANTNDQRCLAIAPGTGILRTGNYDTSTSSCTTTK